MSKIKHTVWPTGVPPVLTCGWDQKAWDNFANGFKPDDYHGDPFNLNDWKKYLKEKQNGKK